VTDWKRCSLRELHVRAETNLLDRWDHTASIVSVIHNLMGLVHNNLGGTPKMKAKPMQAFHPLRNQQHSSGEKLKITRENFHVLKQIFVGGE